jgi:hypothetical protein
MEWSVRRSIRRAILSFAETLTTKGIVAIYLANLPKNLARTHYKSE